MDGGSAANAQRRIAAGDPAVRVDSAVKPGAIPWAYYGKAEGAVSLGLRPEFSKLKTLPVHCFKSDSAYGFLQVLLGKWRRVRR